MKVLFVINDIPYPPNSGGRSRNWNMIKQMSREHDVILLSYGEQNEKVPEAVQAKCDSIIFVEPLKTPTEKWRIYGRMLMSIFFIKPAIVRHRFSSVLRKKIEDLLVSEGIDLILCDNIFKADHMPFGRCPVVLNEHNIESTILKRSVGFERYFLKKVLTYMEYLKLKLYEKTTWPKFDRAFVCSEVDGEIIRKRSPRARVAVIANGVDIDFFVTKEIAQDKQGIVFTGLMNWRPNEDAIDLFVKEIYPLIKAKKPEASFWIVGKDPTDEIKQLAVKDSSIHVTGMVDDIRDYMDQCAIYVVPLRFGSGTRLKILEALSMKKAVISTSV